MPISHPQVVWQCTILIRTHIYWSYILHRLTLCMMSFVILLSFFFFSIIMTSFSFAIHTVVIHKQNCNRNIFFFMICYKGTCFKNWSIESWCGNIEQQHRRWSNILPNTALANMNGWFSGSLIYFIISKKRINFKNLGHTFLNLKQIDKLA